MIRIKRFVIGCAVVFITILAEDFPFRDSLMNTVFTSSFQRMTSVIGYRNFTVLGACHV